MLLYSHSALAELQLIVAPTYSVHHILIEQISATHCGRTFISDARDKGKKKKKLKEKKKRGSKFASPLTIVRLDIAGCSVIYVTAQNKMLNVKNQTANEGNGHILGERSPLP